MANQQQLADLFGAGNLTCLDEEDRELFASAGIVADELFDVGLPDRLPGVFVLEAAAEPEAFDGVRAVLNGVDVTFVTLGAPHDDSRFRYYLNPLDGRVLLAQLESGDPQFEVVNASLGNFVEFLYRIGSYLAAGRGESQLLVADLVARDPDALAKPDSWWSMVLERL